MVLPDLFFEVHFSLSTAIASISVSRHTATTLAVTDAAITITTVLLLVVAGEGCVDVLVCVTDNGGICKVCM